MIETWVPVAAVAAAAVLVGLYLRPRRAEPLVFADEREERLTLEVARAVGCAQAAIRPAPDAETVAPHRRCQATNSRAVRRR